MATIINMKDYYHWYTEDEYIEVSDEVAAELREDMTYEKHHVQRMRRNKSIYSLNLDDGIEASAVVPMTDDPQAVLDKKERHCRLCRALNSLPEEQGRRVEAYFLLGMSQAEIAEAEGVDKCNVSRAIAKGLASMKTFFENDVLPRNFCPQSEAGI